jgi:hypothetical protein
VLLLFFFKEKRGKEELGFAFKNALAAKAEAAVIIIKRNVD